MRTTFSIEDALLKRAKQAALRNHRWVSAEIEAALRTSLLSRSKTDRRAAPLPFKTFAGKGLQAGVDLHSNSDLANLMDGS